ncbi:MAG: PAS domain S-box protein [Bradyrhizobium sp.]|uniref:PAS domain-containing protein n=1 Tax=Bradyrhizobium sp. TaxID=376 RepID=UPI0012153F8D|nr:PAS domain-containing protein [Bradyrhizobium sp.]THD64229.1 MAG: PAS domain S-box protein [Bradyrhizobium sp.]
MNHAEFQLQGVSDPRLAVHATSALPAWLWSSDGTRILWANPVGAGLFGAANGAALAEQTFGPADQHRRQVAQLAGRLPSSGAIRLERMRGFGATLGTLVTCGCARLDFADGSHGILVAAAEAAGRAMPLAERLQRLVEGIDGPVAAFARDGQLVGASDAARSLPGFANLAEAGLGEAGLGEARSDALKQGRAETPIGIGHMVLQRVGRGADVGLVALFAPGATSAGHLRHIAPPLPVAAAVEPVEPPTATIPDYEQPATTGEAPAEFALIDEFAESQVAAAVEPVAEASAPDQPHEPSPYVEAVADEPAAEPAPRRQPLRFTWQMDAEGRFSLGSDEFSHLIGERTAAGFGRLWSDIAEAFGLDPDGRVVKAIATRETWSGIILNWPVDGGARLPVELSGLPVFDRARHFSGYRGFGVCRDLDALTRLEAARRDESLLAGTPATDRPAETQTPASIASETSQQTDVETPVETPNEMLNVLPFRPIGEPKSPVLTPVENSAFNELARQLSARLDTDDGAPATPETAAAPEAVVGPPATADMTEPVSEQPEWLAPPEPPARGETGRDKMLLDLVPVGVLIYRLDRLLYANRAFLDRMGYQTLYALEEAGGLDALYVEPGVSSASSTSTTGTPVTISASQSPSQHAPSSATEAHLFTISWDQDSALALIFSGAQTGSVAAALTGTAPVAAPPEAGHAAAEELGAILDTTAEGVMMFDAEGNINSCNRSAEALFGYDGPELVQRNLAELFAPESQRAVRDYLQSTGDAAAASLLDHGREVLGRVHGGGLIPLSMTMGRTQADSPNFFAVFRDLSQSKKSESELQQARRLTDRAASAKADMLARISHEVRMPLNAIIGFAEVMIGERFGKLGNERYVEYMKDIRASGERVIAIVNDLLDLSRIETGKLDLTFANQNLNDLVEQCVAVMQPQANRERIIIRTSLAHMLPPVVADVRALRQIILNLIGSSIHLANAGGQVIVSTALSDFGEVVLRVRDTGHGLNDDEVAAALEPFRTPAPSDQASDGSGVSLSLTKALVEANRAKFAIKTGAHSGTLVEVVFTHAIANA